MPWAPAADNSCVNAEETQTEVFVARQPIFDRHRQVYAYELLFRSSLKNAFGGMDPRRRVDQGHRRRLHPLRPPAPDRRQARVHNFTRDTLVKGYAAKLRLDERETARIYLEAVEWATSSYAGANGSR